MLSTFKLYSFFSITDGYREMYGDDMLSFNRDRFYLLIKTFFPVLGLATIVYLGIKLLSRSYEFLNWVYIVLAIPSALVLFYLIAKYIINYFLDFVIVVPNKVVVYNQTGILKREIFTLDNVSAVQVSQSGIEQSLFNYGNIEFYTASDNFPSVVFDRTNRPEEKERMILEIIN